MKYVDLLSIPMPVLRLGNRDPGYKFLVPLQLYVTQTSVESLDGMIHAKQTGNNAASTQTI